MAINAITHITYSNIIADIAIKQNRVYDFAAVLTVATNSNVNIQTYIFINNSERNRVLSFILVSYNFFGIKVIYAGIFTRFTSEC